MEEGGRNWLFLYLFIYFVCGGGDSVAEGWGRKKREGGRDRVGGEENMGVECRINITPLM